MRITTLAVRTVHCCSKELGGTTIAIILTSTAYIMEDYSVIRLQMVSLGILSEELGTP